MSSRLKGCFLHQTDHWSTPSDLYMEFMSNGYIDPCPLFSSENCLEKEYFNELLYINPPYSKLNEFTDWIIKCLNNGCFIKLLVPARTDTKWFHKLLPYTEDIWFIKGRLKFGNSKNGAPFPSILMTLSKNGGSVL